MDGRAPRPRRSYLVCDQQGLPYQTLFQVGRLAAQWAAAGERPNFVLPILIEERELRTLLALIKRCDLCGIDDEDAVRTQLTEYLAPAAKPAEPVHLPPKTKATKAPSPSEAAPFPGGKFALSNIAVSVPRHFLGREQELGAIDEALKRDANRVAIAALYGLRGVGKTTLAAAYAQGRKADYGRLVGPSANRRRHARRPRFSRRAPRLGRRRQKGGAWSRNGSRTAARRGRRAALDLRQCARCGEPANYLPTDGAARVLVTSTAHTWRAIAAPVEVRVWPRQVGAAISSPVQDASRSARRPSAI